MRLALILVLLAVPAAAQTPDVEARLEACMDGIDAEAIDARAQAFADARGFEAETAALCAAGDRDGAQALADATEAAFYAEDADAGRLRACLVEVLGDVDFSPGHICDR